jgi:hypothetical protein
MNLNELKDGQAIVGLEPDLVCTLVSVKHISTDTAKVVYEQPRVASAPFQPVCDSKRRLSNEAIVTGKLGIKGFAFVGQSFLSRQQKIYNTNYGGSHLCA